MKAFLITFTLFLSAAHAGDRNTAYNTICKPMTFESDRNDCHDKIKKFNYFNNKAVDICASFDFDSAKINCLESIGDKSYDDFEVDNCANQTFESKKLECLKADGTPYNPGQSVCVSREDTMKELNNSLYDLRNGNLKNVDLRLSNLLARYNSCSYNLNK